MNKYSAIFALLLLLVSCDMIEYHPYDLDIKGETGINAKNIAAIEEKMKGKTEYTFAVLSDTQRWYDETNAAVDYINTLDNVEFVVHTGDLSDFGAKLEFEQQRDILNRLKVPYVCLIGNHDCIASGQAVFNKIFGEEDFAFTAGNVRFICLNTNALEFDYSRYIPDFDFIDNEIDNIGEEIEKTIVAMHAAPYSEQFNNNVAKIFQYDIKRFPDLQFCIHGHWHSYREIDLFDDGIMYYQCPCADKRQFLLFTVNNDGYECELVEY